MLVAFQIEPASPPISSRILLIEDHPVVREGLVRVLTTERDLVVVAQAGRPAEALAALGAKKPDLVLLDLFLGGEHSLHDGFALLGDLLAAQVGVRVLVFTGVAEPEHARRALQLGAAGFVLKSEPTELFLAAIRVVLRGETYLSPRLFVDTARKFVALLGNSLSPALELLSNRELHVLHATGLRLANWQIAVDLGLSVRTVETHKEALKRKLGLADAEMLAVCAREFVAALRR